MLGSALRRSHHRQSASSSSASSTAWSVETDEEEQEDIFLGASSDPDTPDMYEPSFKSRATSFGLCPRPLAYARRPSGTNTRSTVPRLHKRTSSSSSTHHVRGTQSSPSQAHFFAREDDEFSDYEASFRDDDYPDIIPQSAPERPVHDLVYENDSTLTRAAKRSRNRASLPAYFSLSTLR